MDADSEKGDTDEVVGLLRELLRWTRGMARAAVREELARGLPTEDERRVYELTDGAHSTRQIAKDSDVSQTTVSQWHRKWDEQGIVTEVPSSGGKRCRVFSLSEVGLPTVPPMNETDQT